MRLHNFFIEQDFKGTAGCEVSILDEEKIHQWIRVFRFGEGDRVVLLDNSGFEFECEFTKLTKNEAVLEISEKRENKIVPKREIHLFQSLIKNDRFEWVMQKGTELLVSGFTGVLSERSEKKNINLERSRKIITEAAEQCGRGRCPILHDVATLDTALEGMSGKVLVFHGDAPRFSRSDLFSDTRSDLVRVSVFIGPEGGWSDDELELFRKNKADIYSLGAQTLRAETAAVAAASLLLL